LNMAPLPETRDLAQRLLSYEAKGGNASESVGSSTLRVYEKMRQSLGELAGTAGFQALAFRALTLARSEVPILRAVEVTADGSLNGMSAIEPPTNVERDRIHEGGVILISRLLGLLLILLGEALTMNLVRDMWPDAAHDHFNSENGRKT